MVFVILVIDNYDSFTYNLVHILEEFDEVKVLRNDKLTVSDIAIMSPDKIIISPGPGQPKDAGISKEVISYFKDKIDILGVCLGHQCIGEVFGGDIIRADRLVHGKTSNIKKLDEADPIFAGVEEGFPATRYHSLIISEKNFPSELKVIAETEEKEIMAVKHRKYNLYGVQFHPESILTDAGKKILKNFIES